MEPPPAVPRAQAAQAGAEGPKHVRAEVRDDFHRIVYAEGPEAARTAFIAFERTRTKRCPGAVRSLQEGGA
jgi:hypothetical protein